MRQGISVVGWIVLVCTLVIGLVGIATWVGAVQAHQNDALRSIMCFTEKRIEESTQLTVKQKRAAIKFYNQALETAHLDPCHL